MKWPWGKRKKYVPEPSPMSDHYGGAALRHLRQMYEMYQQEQYRQQEYQRQAMQQAQQQYDTRTAMITGGVGPSSPFNASSMTASLMGLGSLGAALAPTSQGPPAVYNNLTLNEIARWETKFKEENERDAGWSDFVHEFRGRVVG
jgi:hypothetical protein